jgi:Zn-dependent protease
MTDTRQEQEPPSRRWAWRLGSLAGISIYVHATFALLLAWIALSHIRAGHGLVMAGQGLLLIGSVFGVVVLHELGHALVARRLGRLPADGSAVVVFEDDRLVGLLDLEHVGELLAARGVGNGGVA